MWGVCSTKPRQTDLAITNLARQGYGTFNPIFEKRKLDRRRKLITVNEPFQTELSPAPMEIVQSNG